METMTLDPKEVLSLVSYGQRRGIVVGLVLGLFGPPVARKIYDYYTKEA